MSPRRVWVVVAFLLAGPALLRASSALFRSEATPDLLGVAVRFRAGHRQERQHFDQGRVNDGVTNLERRLENDARRRLDRACGLR